MTPEYLTPQEVADLLRVTLPTVRHWRATGAGPKAVRAGKHLRYRRSDVEQWLEASASTARKSA